MYNSSSFTPSAAVSDARIPEDYTIPYARIKQEPHCRTGPNDALFDMDDLNNTQQDWSLQPCDAPPTAPPVTQPVHCIPVSHNTFSRVPHAFSTANYVAPSAVVSRPPFLSHSSSASLSSTGMAASSPCSFEPEARFEHGPGHHFMPSSAMPSPDESPRHFSEIDTVATKPNAYTACSCPCPQNVLLTEPPIPRHAMAGLAPPHGPMSPVNPRPYPCYMCTRSFARKHDLQRHLRVHTGDKPYVCLCCRKSFARTDALKRHLRVEDACRTSPAVQAMKNAGKRRYRNL